jgi:[ribosomal protein S5]-alanine N-acetyltransferase
MSDSFSAVAPELTTKRFILRRLQFEDARDVFAYAADPDVARYTLWPPHTSIEISIGFIGVLTQPTCVSWAIVPHGSQRLIGTIFLHNYNKYHLRAEIGFNLGLGYWGQGIAPETGAAVLDFAFEHLRLNRVEATCMPENTRSRRALEKLGLKYEGTMRQSHMGPDHYHDMQLFAVLRADRR